MATPAAAYLPATQSGRYVYTSGQLPLVDGHATVTGKVGKDVAVEEAAVAARLCAVNGLAAVDALVGLDRILKVVNGASDLLIEGGAACGRDGGDRLTPC